MNDDNFLLQQHLQTFTHIAVETVRTKTATVHVLYVAIRTGEIKKLSHDPRTRETCLIEIVEATSAASPIANLRLHKSSLYLATSEAVLKINSSNCGRLQTRRACLAARDPHCGWSRSSSGGGRCVRSPNGNPRTSSWEQASGGCPVLDEPVSGIKRWQVKQKQWHSVLFLCYRWTATGAHGRSGQSATSPGRTTSVITTRATSMKMAACADVVPATLHYHLTEVATAWAPPLRLPTAPDMAAGPSGQNGVLAPTHATWARAAGKESAAILHQLLAVEFVWAGT